MVEVASIVVSQDAAQILSKWATQTAAGSGLFLLEDCWFSKFKWKYNDAPNGRMNSGWRITIDDLEGDEHCHEVTEEVCCRVVYALVCGASAETIRESLSSFEQKD